MTQSHSLFTVFLVFSSFDLTLRLGAGRARRGTHVVSAAALFGQLCEKGVWAGAVQSKNNMFQAWDSKCPGSHIKRVKIGEINFNSVFKFNPIYPKC